MAESTTDLRAFEDPNHEGNSDKYHTGKKCIEKGCCEPAGTWWSPHWCFKHNVERIHRIDAGLNDIILSSRLRRMVNDETKTLRAYCERLRKERDSASLIIWRRITPEDRIPGKDVLLTRGQPYTVWIGQWHNARTIDRGAHHVRPYDYPAGWYADSGRRFDGDMEPLWIANITPPPSVPGPALPSSRATEGGGNG